MEVLKRAETVQGTTSRKAQIRVVKIQVYELEEDLSLYSLLWKLQWWQQFPLEEQKASLVNIIV